MSGASDEVMMPVPTPEALAQSQIQALRALTDSMSSQGKQISAHMEATTRALERLTNRVDGMGERITRLEEQKHGREIERLERHVDQEVQRLVERADRNARNIDALQSEQDQRKGAMGLLAWARQTTPWLVAIIMAGLAALGYRPNGG